MQTLISQENLDVRQKTRANTFNWRGQFTPQLIEHFLANYAGENDIVADPFSGSGTVLAECASRNLEGYGLEINPAAYTMSKFYAMAGLCVEERESILGDLHNKVFRVLDYYSELPIWYESKDYRQQYENLIRFTQDVFSLLERGFEKTIALNMLFISESHKKLSLRDSVCSSFKTVEQIALSLPLSSRPLSAKLLDARLLHTAKSIRPHLIITSPPYINVFNYHQNHRAILEAVGWDMLKVASSEFGSNRKNRGNRFKTVVQFCLDMEESLHSFWHSLQDDGLLLMVIGKESNVRGVAFYNGNLVKEIAQTMEGFEMIEERERSFINKFGLVIKEDIFVLRKKHSFKNSSVGKQIAMKHLESSIAFASTPEVAGDVKNALCCIDSISSSPLFDARESFIHD